MFVSQCLRHKTHSVGRLIICRGERVQQVGKLISGFGALLRLMVLPGLPSKDDGQSRTNTDEQRASVIFPPVLDCLDLFFFGAQLRHENSCYSLKLPVYIDSAYNKPASTAARSA